MVRLCEILGKRSTVFMYLNNIFNWSKLTNVGPQIYFNCEAFGNCLSNNDGTIPISIYEYVCSRLIIINLYLYINAMYVSVYTYINTVVRSKCASIICAWKKPNL